MNSCGGAEGDPVKAVGIELGGLDLAATTGRHCLHPAQTLVAAHGASESSRTFVGDSVEGIGAIQDFLEQLLLGDRPAKCRISGMVPRVAHRRQQCLIDDEFNSGLDVDHVLDERIADGGGCGDSQMSV